MSEIVRNPTKHCVQCIGREARKERESADADADENADDASSEVTKA